METCRAAAELAPPPPSPPTPSHARSEGNYLLLPDPPWSQLRSLFHEVWFVECGEEECMARVAARQAAHGVPPAVSRERVAGNDRPNARAVAGTAGGAALVVPSLPFRG